MEIYAVKCSEGIDEVTYNTLLSYLSKIEKNRIDSFRYESDANRTLIGKIMAKTLLCRSLKLKVNQLNIRTNKYGKPYLNEASMHFNISHSGIWIVCIIDTKKVGIDIEEIVDINIEDVSVFLSEGEQEALALKRISKRNDYFFDLWSLKESYIKAIGRGLSIKLESFSIEKNSKSIEIEGGEEEVYFKQYEIDPNYKLSICAENCNFPESVEELSLNDLIRFSMNASIDDE